MEEVPLDDRAIELGRILDRVRAEPVESQLSVLILRTHRDASGLCYMNADTLGYAPYAIASAASYLLEEVNRGNDLWYESDPTAMTVIQWVLRALASVVIVREGGDEAKE